MKILILCTGNSCRSQMALGFLRSYDERLEVHSAGTNPGREINPKAIEVMAELQIDISRESPKSVERYLNEAWDYVITVCDDANEACPFFPGRVQHRLHLGFDDPSNVSGSDDYVMSEFRRIRDQIAAEFKSLYEIQIKPLLV